LGYGTSKAVAIRVVTTDEDAKSGGAEAISDRRLSGTIVGKIVGHEDGGQPPTSSSARLTQLTIAEESLGAA
jgi:hypothetical protein